jgi:hypothetical protein
LAVIGIDVMSVLVDGQKKRRFDEGQQRRLREFMRTDDAADLLDGVATLYVQLDTLESSNAVAAFKAPFGALRTSLELITGHYRGIDQLSDIADSGKQTALRDACAGGRCQLSGKGFVVQRSGMFDTLTNVAARSRRAQGQCIDANKPSTHSSTGEVTPQLLESICGTGCDGYCGPGCCTPGDIQTPECAGHDRCVDQYGHLDCLFGTPDGCVECNSLIEAVISWINGLLDKLLRDSQAASIAPSASRVTLVRGTYADGRHA